MDENPKSPKAFTFLAYELGKNGQSSRNTTEVALVEFFSKAPKSCKPSETSSQTLSAAAVPYGY